MNQNRKSCVGLSDPSHRRKACKDTRSWRFRWRLSCVSINAPDPFLPRDTRIKERKVLPTFSVSHPNTSCVSLKSSKTCRACFSSSQNICKAFFVFSLCDIFIYAMCTIVIPSKKPHQAAQKIFLFSLMTKSVYCPFENRPTRGIQRLLIKLKMYFYYLISNLCSPILKLKWNHLIK